MGAGKLRVRAGSGVMAAAAVAVTALAGGCSGAASSSLAVSPAQSPATPTVTPTSVPVLGRLTLGSFPATPDGLQALAVCEQWAGLRGQYVALVRSDTPYQLEQWFSGSQWSTAFTDAGQFSADPAYRKITAAFGVATSGEVASITTARLLDAACTAAD